MSANQIFWGVVALAVGVLAVVATALGSRRFPRRTHPDVEAVNAWVRRVVMAIVVVLTAVLTAVGMSKDAAGPFPVANPMPPAGPGSSATASATGPGPAAPTSPGSLATPGGTGPGSAAPAPSSSLPAGPHVGCPISSPGDAEPQVGLTVVNWCLHESEFLSSGRRELKLKPLIENRTGHTIDISLPAWRLVVSADVDIKTWKPIRGVEIAQPTKIDCGGIAAWAVPANGNNLTYKQAFATHWDATRVRAKSRYVDRGYYRGDIVWWTPKLTEFVTDPSSGIQRASQVLGVALLDGSKIVAFSPVDEWTDEAWTNPSEF
jgi:hypothetical protein